MRTLPRVVQELDIVLLPFVLLLLLVSPRTLWLGLLLATLPPLARLAGGGSVVQRTPLDVALALLLLGALLSGARAPAVSWQAVGYLAAGPICYYAIVNWGQRYERRLRLLAGALVALGMALVLISPFSVQWMPDSKLPFLPSGLYSRFQLVLADAIHPNVMASALLLLWPLPLALALDARRRGRTRICFALATLLMLATLLLTKSRGAYLGTLAGLGMLLVACWPRLRLPALAGAMGTLGCVVFTPSLASLARAGLAASGGSTPEWRLGVWWRALLMLRDSGGLGIGPGNFARTLSADYPLAFGAGYDVVTHAHNLWLQVVADAGVLGLVGFLAVQGLGFWLAARLLPTPPYAWLGRALLASLSALCVHGLVDAGAWAARPAFLLWALLGLLAAAHNQLRLAGYRQALEISGSSALHGS